MSKAILVLEMPEKCIECPILEHCHNNDGKCDLNIKQSWCPLKEIPQKAIGFGTDNQYVMGRKDGWNNCIDKLLGE